ncbi:hypothetical protein ASZ78_009447, partial [Callipepla squamata]
EAGARVTTASTQFLKIMSSLSLTVGSVTPDASSEGKFFSDPSEKAALTIQTHFRRYQQQKQGKK